MLEQKFTLGTIVSGRLNVIIEEIGSFGANFVNMSLQTYAGNVYAYLTRQPVIDNGDLFQLVSFDPDKEELVVRVKK